MINDHYDTPALQPANQNIPWKKHQEVKLTLYRMAEAYFDLLATLPEEDQIYILEGLTDKHEEHLGRYL